MEPLPLPTQEAPDVVINAVDPPVIEAVVQPQEPVITSREPRNLQFQTIM